ncbi:MAG: hypothetical protein ACXWKR_07260 [Phenylobacterium sp.]
MRLLTAALCTIGVSLATAAQGGIFRRTAPPGHCRVVHGRMAIYNGTFSFRIWAIGTHRMLRVVDEALDNFGDVGRLPPELARALDPYRENLWGHDVFADFKVCDVTESRPGVMQTVTLAGATRIRVAP